MKKCDRSHSPDRVASRRRRSEGHHVGQTHSDGECPRHDGPHRQSMSPVPQPFTPNTGRPERHAVSHLAGRARRSAPRGVPAARDPRGDPDRRVPGPAPERNASTTLAHGDRWNSVAGSRTSTLRSTVDSPTTGRAGSSPTARLHRRRARPGGAVRRIGRRPRRRPPRGDPARPRHRAPHGRRQGARHLPTNPGCRPHLAVHRRRRWHPRCHHDSDGEPIDVPLVPYREWANRGPSTMRVWIPTTN